MQPRILVLVCNYSSTIHHIADKETVLKAFALLVHKSGIMDTLVHILCNDKCYIVLCQTE